MSKNVPPLIENFMEKCVLLEKTRVSDGLGGNEVAYKDGASFMAAVNKEKSLDARVAEKEGVTEVYTVTTAEGVALEFHEVFRRERDKATFRVTSNASDSKPPKAASFSFEQVSAERWSIPG